MSKKTEKPIYEVVVTWDLGAFFYGIFYKNLEELKQKILDNPQDFICHDSIPDDIDEIEIVIWKRPGDYAYACNYDCEEVESFGFSSYLDEKEGRFILTAL